MSGIRVRWKRVRRNFYEFARFLICWNVVVKEPNLKEIEEIRRTGLRPGVVACLLKDKQVLMTYVSEFSLWQLPQGGIEVDETVKGALVNTVQEELGADIAHHLDLNMEIIGEDRMEFPDSGGKKFESKGGLVLMIGKHYYVVAAKSHGGEFDLKKSEVSIARWVNYEEGVELAKKIYQKGKRRVTETVLKLLQSGNFIA